MWEPQLPQIWPFLPSPHPLGQGLSHGSHGGSQVNSPYFLASSHQGGRGCVSLGSSLPVLTTAFVLPISLETSGLIFSVQHIWEKHIILS